MEDPNKFDPSTQQKKHYRRGRVSIWKCECGPEWIKPGEYCLCQKKRMNTSGINIKVDSCRGWYEHLDTKPIFIESKQHLYRECIKRNVQARCLMSGGVMKKPRGV